MIKFEEHDGKLFRMLEEPVPLTPDAEMPCLVRLIQDDSPMGRLNLYAYDAKELTPKICTEVIGVNDLSDYNRGSVRCDGFISCQHYHYELIGTFVEDGSKDWALYQMMQGEKVTFLDYPNRILRLVNGYIQDSINDGFWNRKSGDEFLSYASSPGWQIYKEHEPSKPKYRVGDSVICEYHRSPLPKQISYERVIDVDDVTVITQSQNGNVCVYDINGNHGDINGWHIDRVISPSEHIVTIGCLSGTVERHDGNPTYWFKLRSSEYNYALISIEMLDTQTRELVESLLKAQRRGDIK